MQKNYKTILLEHPISKRVKICPIGFSWDTLLFIGFVPFFRGLNKLGFIISGILLLLWTIEIFVFITPGSGILALVQLIFLLFGFVIYVLLGQMMNKYCIEAFLKEGYIPMDEASIEVVKYL